MVAALKEPVGTVCHAFEAFSRGYILLELEMIGFLPIIFKLFFRVAGFAHVSMILSPSCEQGAMAFRSSSLLIRKPLLANALS